MAIGENTLRDGIQPVGHPLPPGQKVTQIDHEALVGNDRSFLVGVDVPKIPLDAANIANESYGHYHYLQNPYYRKYVSIDKGLVNTDGAQELEEIYEGLVSETNPRYLVAAGWAAAESALMNTEASTEDRLTLLSAGVGCWQRAFTNVSEPKVRDPEEEIELYGHAHRIALDIATAPLLAGIIVGSVSQEACRKAFEDTLEIADSNLQWAAYMKETKNYVGLSRHQGVAYECNMILIRNLKLLPGLFAIPAPARCDTGYFNTDQTHDLLLIKQKFGNIKRAVPVEIKSRARLRDTGRLKALIVQKTDLGVPGKWRPEYTFEAIEAVYKGTRNKTKRAMVGAVRSRIDTMVERYVAGERLGQIAGLNAVTMFHDGRLIYEPRLRLPDYTVEEVPV